MSPRVVSSLSPTITPEESRGELRGARGGEVGEHGDRAGARRNLADQELVHVLTGARRGLLVGAGKGVAVPLQQEPALVVDERDEPPRRRVVLGAQAPADHGRRRASAP